MDEKICVCGKDPIPLNLTVVRFSRTHHHFTFHQVISFYLQKVGSSLFLITYYSQGSLCKPLSFFCIVKGTICVISSYCQCKDGNTVPLKVHNFGATKSFMYTTTVQLKLSSPSQGLLYCQQLRHKKNLNRRNLVAKYCRNLLVLVDQG